MQDTLRVQMPINQSRVTAIGYHASGADVLPLEPVGSQANAGLLKRIFHRLFGQSGSEIRYYQLDGGVGRRPAAWTSARRSNGRLLAGGRKRHRDLRPDRQREGLRRAHRHPAVGQPGVVVTVENLKPDPALTVGSTVSAGRTKIGRIIDLSSVEQAALAHHTQDKGQHVHIEVHAAASRHPRSSSALRILFIGDVFGPPGRRAVEHRLQGLREELDAQFCVVNGENAADGMGLTAKLAEKLLAAGADVVTLGNHVWRQRDLIPVLEQSDRVVRPANLGGRAREGLTVSRRADGTPVAVINLQGALFLDVAVHPFLVVDELVEEAAGGRGSSSSTSTPRRRARRSRSPGSSTAASPP